MTSDQLDLFPTEESSPPAGHAKTSPWQDVVLAWLEHGPDSGGKSSASWVSSVRVGSLAKTSLASCHRSANALETDPALPMDIDPPALANLTTSNPMDAASADAWKRTAVPWVPSSGRWLTSGMGSPIEFWTLSTSEFPNSVVESSLSDILEPPGEHLRKYYLSPKAATGILRRAGRRGRRLPTLLQEALERLAAT